MPEKYMTQEDLLKQITKLLGQRKISYMITGAYGVIYYGRPRTSHDLDFVIEVDQKDISKLLGVFQDSNSDDFIYQEEVIAEAIIKKGMFNVIYRPSGDKLDFWIVKTGDFDRKSFARRVSRQILGQEMVLATAEDTIIQKLRWYNQGKREKDLIDAAFAWKLQKKLDKGYITNWAKKLGVESYLKELDAINLEDYY